MMVAHLLPSARTAEDYLELEEERWSGRASARAGGSA